MARISKDCVTTTVFMVAVLFLIKKFVELHQIASSANDVTPHETDHLRTDNNVDGGLINGGLINVAGGFSSDTQVKHKFITTNVTFESDLGLSDVGDLDSIFKTIQKQMKCPNCHRPTVVTHATTGPSWQHQTSADESIYLHTAYFDDRAGAGRLPNVRLHVISTFKKEAKLFCQIWYKGLTSPYIVPVKISKTGRGDKFKGIFYGQWLYSCQLPGIFPVPEYVSVVAEMCNEPTALLPILTPIRSMWKKEFGVCVAIAFGEISIEELVEWIEFYKLLGVEEFNIYNGTMSQSMSKVLHHYIHEGILRLIQMPPPVPEYSKAGAKLSSPASLNDCMLRNMYRYKFAVIVDFDEYIVPKTSLNYHTLIEEINKKEKLASDAISYSFRNVYYFLDFKPDQHKPRFLRTMRYRTHVPENNFLFAAKSFIDPLNCLSVFNHYCYLRFPNAPKSFSVDVPIKFATNQHYRLCNYKCEEKDKSPTINNDILKFEKNLTQQVKQKLHLLNVPV